MADVSKINGYNIKDTSARDEIVRIKSGLTKVGAAQGADIAAGYTEVGGIKTKFDAIDGQIADIVDGTTQVKSAERASVATKYLDEVNGPISIYEEFHIVKSSATRAYNLANDAKVIAEGRAKAVSFDTVAAMTAALKAASKSDYKIGDNLFIKATDVPDYWVSGVLDTNTGTYGYFTVSPLETQKVDLTEYAKTADITTSGTIKAKYAGTADYAKGYTEITGAPSDVTLGEKFKTIKSEYDGVNSEITKIKDGTTTVPKAALAVSATTAITAVNYDTVNGAIKDKFDAHDTQINSHQAEITKIINGSTTVGKATRVVSPMNFSLQNSVETIKEAYDGGVPKTFKIEYNVTTEELKFSLS